MDPFFDIRDSFRALRRDAGYSATVLATLALTIGATTAVFSIVDGVLLEPLAYPEAHQLVSIHEVWREASTIGSSLEVNEQHFEYWRARARSFDSMAQFIALPANLTGRGDAAQITVVHASASIFDVLRVDPAAGRALTPADERADSPDVVVLTDACWRGRFEARLDLVGQSVVIDGVPHTVVGILGRGFRLPAAGRLVEKMDAFVPIHLERDRIGWVGDHNNAAIGRLKPGTTIEQARSELDVLQTQVSDLATKQAHEPVTLATSLSPLTETVIGAARRGLLLLLGAVAAVLLIACSNLANLSLTRASSRQREAAIRAALGASRVRLMTRVVVEQLVLAAVGGAGALLVARAALALFVRTAPLDLPRVADVTLDARVFAFAAAIALASGLLVALLPAWHLARTAAQPTLRASGAAATADKGSLRTPEPCSRCRSRCRWCSSWSPRS